MGIYAINANTLAPSTWDLSGVTVLDIVEHQGRLYALTATAIYEFDGSPQDISTDISWIIKWGKMDFGMRGLKRTRGVYVSGKLTAHATFTVDMEQRGKDYSKEYRIDRRSGVLEQQYEPLSNGVKSQFIQPQISGTGVFEFDNIEMRVDLASRNRKI